MSTSVTRFALLFLKIHYMPALTRDGHRLCERTKCLKTNEIFRHSKKTNDGRTTWIVRRNVKKNITIFNEWKKKFWVRWIEENCQNFSRVAEREEDKTFLKVGEWRKTTFGDEGGERRKKIFLFWRIDIWRTDQPHNTKPRVWEGLISIRDISPFEKCTHNPFFRK